MSRWFPAVGILALAFGIVACAGGITTTRVAAPVLQLPGNATSLAISGATTAQFSVSEPGYNGTFTATSSNTAVATVTPMTIQSSSDTRAAESERTVASDSGGATFTIETFENGTTTITVSDQNGGSSQFIVTVTGASPAPSASPTASPTATPLVVASPAALNFTATGQTGTVAVSENAYSGSFAAASSNTGVATVSPASGTSFTISAVAAGTASVTFTDSNQNSSSVSVTVTTSSGSITSRTRQ